MRSLPFITHLSSAIPKSRVVFTDPMAYFKPITNLSIIFILSGPKLVKFDYIYFGNILAVDQHYYSKSSKLTFLVILSSGDLLGELGKELLFKETIL